MFHLLKHENDKDFQLKLFNLIAANNSRKKNFAESIKYFRKISEEDMSIFKDVKFKNNAKQKRVKQKDKKP